ncbi:MAG: class IV adenylate cyclase [Ferruginibacter sp.]|nr:class IV adenylate cyclase [Ferruginibacter sp.]
MAILNIEFKAKINDLVALEQKLQSLNPIFIGEDNQIDTYYTVQLGRLKLREGNIENALIWYNRQNIVGPKQSDILLYKHLPDKTLKDILGKLHSIKIIVEKKRRIYFVENVKIHFDIVENLGTFLEVEAIDNTGDVEIEKLQEQCNYFAHFFGIEQSNYMKNSYSDMLVDSNFTNKHLQ